ncbi:MAG: hypothetical protein ABI622_02855 [Chloroflexota bacterium]
MASDPRRGPRVPFDPDLGWALVGIVAVAIVIGAALIFTSPGPVDAPDGSSAASASPLPTGSGAGLTIPGPPLALEDGTWVRTAWRDAQDHAPHDGVSVGRLDGTITAELPFSAPSWARGYGPPFLRGPQAGMVLIADGDAPSVAFDLLDAATGRTAHVGTVDRAVPDAVLSTDATQIYFLVDGEAGLSVARIATDGSGTTEGVAPPRPRVARSEGIVLAASLVRRATLVLSPDETTLAVSDCFTTCEIRLITLASGAERLLQGISGISDWMTWSDAGIGIGTMCIDPRTGLPGERSCPSPDLEASFGASVELPAGWRAELRPVPDAPPMSFALQVVAIGPDGEEVVLDALGAFNGNG